MKSRVRVVAAVILVVFGGLAYITIRAQSVPAVATKLAEGPGGPPQLTSITGLSQSNDGHMLATQDDNKTVSVWDARTGANISTLQSTEQEWIGPATFSPDGSMLATPGSTPRSDSAGHLLLWDPASGQRLASFDNISWPVCCVAFNSTGTLLAIAGNTTLYLIDPNTRAYVQQMEMERVVNGSIKAIEFSPAGDLLATAKRNGKVELWQVADLTLVRALSVGPSGQPTSSRALEVTPPSPEVRSVTFAHSLPRLAANTSEGSVFVWDINTGKEIAHYPYGGSVNAPLADSLSFTLDDRWLLTVDQKAQGIRFLSSRGRSATNNLLTLPSNTDVGAFNVSPSDGTMAFAYRSFHPDEPGPPTVKFEIWSVKLR